MFLDFDLNELLIKKQNNIKFRTERPIDIVFLTYNRLEYFKQTVAALINNTRYPYNIIIVDNNSNDEFKNFLSINSKLFDKIIYNNKNEWTSAFQKGIDVTTSDPFILSDPDILVPNLEKVCWLERVINLHEQYPEIGLLALNLSDDNKPPKMPDVYLGDKQVYNNEIILSNVGTVFQSIKRRYFNFKYVTDWETCERIRLNGGKVGFAKNIIAYHLGWNEEQDYPEYIVDKYAYFKETYGVDTYLYYISNNELIQTISEKANHYFNNSRPEIQKLVDPNAKKILDVGCASGFLGYSLKIKNNAEVWGIEISKEAAEKAMNKLDKVIIMPIEEAINFLPDNYFDTIICADVLEHLIDPEGVLIRLKEKLTDKGEFIISLPNILHIDVIIGLLNCEFEYKEAGILDKTHLRFFTKSSALRMIRNCGLREIHINYNILTNLDNKVELGSSFLQGVKEMGFDEKRFEEESKIYQYIIKAKKVECIETTIIIPFVNNYELTLNTVYSIQNLVTVPIKILLIDDGSTEDELQKIKEGIKGFDNTSIIKNNFEHGFASAINRGLLEVDTEFIILANNDIIVTKGAVERFLEIARSSEIGIIGCFSNYSSGIQQTNEIVYDNLEDLLILAEQYVEKHKNTLIYFPRVAFFFTLIKKELVDKIGGLDERFNPGNYEDDDFCLRTHLAGYKIAIAKDVFIHHYGSKSFNNDGLEYYAALLKKNEGKFVEKWGATPDEIFTNKVVNIKKRKIHYPINKNKGYEYLSRALINIDENEYLLAVDNLRKVINYSNENNLTEIADISVNDIKLLLENLINKLENK